MFFLYLLSHSLPIQPESQEQLPEVVLQSPFPLQLLGQDIPEQFSPVNPSLQVQNPVELSQIPFPLQLSGQVRSKQ